MTPKAASQDSWLLTRVAPNVMKRETNSKDNTDNDSGLDCTAPEEKEALLQQSEEMMEIKTNLLVRHGRLGVSVRPRIPQRLCKVTKV